MTTNLSTVIKNANLKPKDWAKLLIADLLEKAKTGKETLTSKDRQAILNNVHAFKTIQEADNYNKYIKVWFNQELLCADVRNAYVEAEQAYQSLCILAVTLLKSSLVSFKANEALSIIESKNPEVAKDYDVYFEVAHSQLDYLNPFVEIKKENGMVVVDLEKGFKVSFELLVNRFVGNYRKLLAFNDILKKISKAFELDFTFKTTRLTERLKEKAKEYNENFEFCLTDFSSGRNLKDKNKRFVSRNGIYLDIEDVEMCGETFSGNIKLFEEHLGDTFWEN